MEPLNPLMITIGIVVLYVIASIKILNEYERGVIFRLGKLLPQPKGPGIILVFAPSFEPLSEEIFFDEDVDENDSKVIHSGLDNFNWIIIGGRSRCSMPELQPEWNWVESLMVQARNAGCQVYFKPNLTVRPREYPHAK